MRPHPQPCSHLLSKPTVVNGSTRYHTPASLIHSLNSFSASQISLTTKTTDDAEISPPLSHFPHALRGHQASINVIPHLLPALCAFAHVSHIWYYMDFQPFPGLISFSIDNSLVNCKYCVDDNVSVGQCHRSHCILVGDGHYSTVCVPLRVYDLDEGRYLPGEMPSGDPLCNFLVHLVGQRYIRVSHYN